MKSINPALLTFEEYHDLVNPKHKEHPDSAYQADAAELASADYLQKENFQKLLKRVRIKGIMFEFRLHARPVKYVHKDEQGEHRRDAENNLIYMTPEEIKQSKLKPHDFTLGVFNEDGNCVGSVQDEWGTILVRVAREYRGFGLGPMLTKIARTMEPEKSSGGFTPSGYRNFFKTYQSFVRDALSSGFYRKKFLSGEITHERIREIVASAKLEEKSSAAPATNLGTSDPADWLLHVGGNGDFVLYDRKLKDIYQDNDSYWVDKMIKGATFVRAHPDGNALIMHFHGATDQIKKFLMSCVISYCFNEKIGLYVDPEDISYVNSRLADAEKQPDMKSGHKRYFVTPKGSINYERMGHAEKTFRRSFDKYGEFENTVLEVGFSN